MSQSLYFDVKFINGEKIKAEVKLKDQENDIAFLKLERQPQLPPSNLKIGEMETPAVGENEILVKCEASTLNYADLLLSSGLYQSNPEPPFVPGFIVTYSLTTLFAPISRLLASPLYFKS